LILAEPYVSRGIQDAMRVQFEEAVPRLNFIPRVTLIRKRFKMLSSSDFDVTEAIRFFNEYLVEVSFLVPTQTGLKKNILDATSPLRNYLKQKGIHEYEDQLQGKEGKKIKKSFFVTESSYIPTDVSFYRPKAKGKDGDPRIWPSKLPSYAAPRNLLALIALNGYLYFVNLSRPEILKSATKSGSPLNKLLNKSSEPTSEIALELLDKLKKIARRGWVPTVTPGSTGVGMTGEKHLGLRPNSKKKPDYKGVIECKFSRNNFGSSSRTTLFAKVANWELSSLKSSAQILDTYGYMRKGIKRLNCTVKSEKPNSQGLFFKVKDSTDELHECARLGKKIINVAIWEFSTLREELLDKHMETFFIAAKSKTTKGVEHFQYFKVKHGRLPFAANFQTLVQEGIITMDHLIKRNSKGVKEKGPLFKIHPKDLSYLYPSPVEYELL
jgi:hypothetical protein